MIEAVRALMTRRVTINIVAIDPVQEWSRESWSPRLILLRAGTPGTPSLPAGSSLPANPASLQLLPRPDTLPTLTPVLPGVPGIHPAGPQPYSLATSVIVAMRNPRLRPAGLRRGRTGLRGQGGRRRLPVSIENVTVVWTDPEGRASRLYNSYRPRSQSPALWKKSGALYDHSKPASLRWCGWLEHKKRTFKPSRVP